MGKIGIYGGTFNPFHNGHVEIPLKAKEQLGLDKIILVPNGMPPHKQLEGNISNAARLEMTKLVAKSNGFEVLEYEINSTETSYTYKTLSYLKDIYKDDELYFLMGQDSFDYLDKWYKPEIICNLAIIAVAGRKGNYDSFNNLKSEFEAKFGGRYEMINMEMFDISSTEIRDLVKDGISIKEFVPDYIEKYILDHHIYKPVVFDEKITELNDIVKSTLKESRYLHTLGVADTAKKLAFNYNYPENNAYLAGLMHDFAKYMDNDEMINLCLENNLGLRQIEEENPYLLHGKVASFICKRDFEINDEDILHAIAVHTTGCENMSLLDKIIFVADYIEPGRDRAFNLDHLREIAFTDIDLCCKEILEDTIAYLKDCNKAIDERAIEALNYFKERE